MPAPATSLRPRLSAANLRATPSLPENAPPTPATPHGFRAQINQLIPRHSYFRARITIHQIDSVPFVSGQFAVRWKFKQVHSPPSTTRAAGLLGMVKTRSKNGDRTNAVPRDDISLDAASTTTTSSSSSGNTSYPSVVVSTNSTDSSSSSVSTSTTRIASLSQPVTNNAQSDSPSGAPSPVASNNANASSTTLHIHSPTIRVCPSSAPTSSGTAVLPSATSSIISTASTPARGHTPYNELKDHSVHWNQTLSTVIRLDVDRDNGYVFPCPFKLVVMQRPSDGDYICSSGAGNMPEVHRLGALYLNLSEYVGHGKVERRYLLRESKTNATLKLTTDLEFISGQTNYIPPPLPKGEILNGLSGYLAGGLSKSSFYGTSGALNTPEYRQNQVVSPRVDLYGPYSNQEELELDLFGTQCPKKSINKSRSQNLGLGISTNDVQACRVGEEEEEDSDIDFLDDFVSPRPRPQITDDTDLAPTPTRPTFFDVERLPLAYGTKATETLIEAIFNPVKISEERCDSPFTIYVPPSPQHISPLDTLQPSGLNVDAAVTMTKMGEVVTPRPPHVQMQKRKPVPNIEVASIYSTSSSSSGSGSGSGHSGALSRSIHSQISQTSTGSRVSRNVGVGNIGTGTSGGGRVKDWWKKTVGGVGMGNSRPGTPSSSTFGGVFGGTEDGKV